MEEISASQVAFSFQKLNLAKYFYHPEADRAFNSSLKWSSLGFLITISFFKKGQKDYYIKLSFSLRSKSLPKINTLSIIKGHWLLWNSLNSEKKELDLNEASI